MYEPIWRAMQRFTSCRGPETSDEIWLLEHFPVYTQGMNGKPEHILDPKAIPVIAIDRGGQVTYHGPGQLIVYCLLDLKRRQLSPRQVVSMLEQAVLAVLTRLSISAYAKMEAPGIYIAEQKIASIGLRIRRGACYHGLSINIDMDLQPFLGINPCGYQQLAVTQLHHYVPELSFAAFSALMQRQLNQVFG